jgi:hypothetical protein
MEETNQTKKQVTNTVIIIGVFIISDVLLIFSQSGKFYLTEGYQGQQILRSK